MKYLIFFLMSFSLAAKTIVIGSKNFTESYILAELVAQVIEKTGELEVKRKFGLGGTGITYSALEAGEIDLYPEYTGTIEQAILKGKPLAELNNRFELSPSLGFNNTYALATKGEWVKSISALKDLEDYKSAFTHEFAKRTDGLPALEKHYEFSFPEKIFMEHSLAV